MYLLKSSLKTYFRGTGHISIPYWFFFNVPISCTFLQQAHLPHCVPFFTHTATSHPSPCFLTLTYSSFLSTPPVLPIPTLVSSFSRCLHIPIRRPTGNWTQTNMLCRNPCHSLRGNSNKAFLLDPAVDQQKQAGLQYMRAGYPMSKVAAASQWIQKLLTDWLAGRK